MPKNVVLCCDGTANEFTRDRTNVVKLFGALIKDPRSSLLRSPGWGPWPAGFVTKSGAKVAEIAGLAFGYGIKDDIGDLYGTSAEITSRDRVHLFGFSRGAYTVRALASLLHMYGLIPKDNERLVPYAVRMMWAIHALQRKDREDESAQAQIAEYSLSNEFKATFSRERKPHFLGVSGYGEFCGVVHESHGASFYGFKPRC